MNFNLKSIIGITAFLISQAITAQFYVGVQSGIGNIQSDVKGTRNTHRPTSALKAGYIYNLNKHFGVGSGIEFAQYNHEVSLSNPSATFKNFEVDPSTSAFEYNMKTVNYKEKQCLNALQIPLFVQYKTNINKGIDFNVRAGAKYFLPVKYKMDAKADAISGTAYYPDVNLFIDDLPEYGFGTQTNYAATGEYNTKGIVMSSFELGFTFDMGTKNSLYAAMFFENGYGSVINQKSNESYIGYNPTSVSDRKVNGLYSTDKDAKVNPIAFGVTLAWNFK